MQTQRHLLSNPAVSVDNIILGGRGIYRQQRNGGIEENNMNFVSGINTLGKVKPFLCLS